MRRRFFYNKSEKDAYLTIEALEDGLSVSFHSMSNSIEYSIDESQNWKILQYDATTDSILKGQKIKFRGYCVPIHEGIGRFHITRKCKLYGNCMSLLYYDKASLFNRVLDYCFYELFFGCPIISVSNDFLPATILAESCYEFMFGYCSSMIEAPTLPATILAESCYESMFEYCTNLNYIKMLATDISATNCLLNWVEGVSPTGTFVKSKDATWDTTPGALGYDGVPAGWTVITEEEEGESPYAFSFNIVTTDGYYEADTEDLAILNRGLQIINQIAGGNLDFLDFDHENAPQEFDLRINGVRNFNFSFSNLGDEFTIYFSFNDGVHIYFGRENVQKNNLVFESFKLYRA